MRIGIHVDTSRNDLGAGVEAIVAAARRGLASAWVPQILGLDALTTLTLAGQQAPDIELGTGVVPTWPRHPLALASQALTTQAAVGGRLVLGIGLSHQMVVEHSWGIPFSRPAAHMAEYLDALMPALAGEDVQVTGETITARTLAPMRFPGVSPCSVVVAALGPAMLRLAGERTDGTVTWMTGPRTIADHITPSITAAAERAGRRAPRVIVGLPVCVTDDPDAARERAARTFVMYGQLPSYRAMLDREGVDGPADVAMVGDEGAVTAAIHRMAETGATDFAGAIFGSSEERTRTLDVLAGLARG